MLGLVGEYALVRPLVLVGRRPPNLTSPESAIATARRQDGCGGSAQGMHAEDHEPCPGGRPQPTLPGEAAGVASAPARPLARPR
jgi:hypothetical protein